MKPLTLFACIALILAPTGLAAAETAWQPEKTWAFVVGVLEFKDNKFSSFPKEGRRDERLVNTLKSRGVPTTQITYIQDKAATTGHVRAEFEKFLDKPQEGDWVFFYFTGHGYNSSDHKETYLATYDAGDPVGGWAVNPIPKAINRRCKASYAIMAVDNCNSGGLAEAVKNLSKPRVNFCVLTSAHWNSSSTPHWTFTENLIYGFAGEPFMDDNSDGVVTFDEIRANVLMDMTFAENQMPQFAKTADFDTNWVVAKDRTKPDPKLGERAEFLSQGKWWTGFTVARDGEKRKVRYYGWDVKDDEWITPTQMRHPPRKEEWPVGTNVEAHSSGQWYAGRIVAVKEGLHLIKFEGWTADWNEWLPAEKLKKK
ncbi:hypothetical protein AYO47_00875 [Planctomyces sp. SCGC AG-212-M04]|nr:hypothetical protein AYO47_00875 [Planctomyces sp. SCGC AG-212-M04]